MVLNSFDTLEAESLVELGWVVPFKSILDFTSLIEGWSHKGFGNEPNIPNDAQGIRKQGMDQDSFSLPQACFSK